jgi:hypothetical protein
MATWGGGSFARGARDPLQNPQLNDKQAASVLAQGGGAKSAPVPVHGGATGRSDAPTFMSTYENSLETHAKQAGAGDAFSKAAQASHEHALAAGRTSGEESMRHMDLAEAHAENARAIGEAAKNYNGVMERNPSYNNLRAKGDADRAINSAKRIADATHRMDPWRKK